MRMHIGRHAALLALAFALAAAGGLAHGASAPAKDYEPRYGQDGKDVVWVPTDLIMVNRMLDIAEVTPNDFVIDLGSGDGRTVITAAKRGARALGIEYNADMVALSQRLALKEGVGERAQFVRGDIFRSDFSQATVITLFLLPELNLKLRPRLLQMRPGTRIVSNSFDMDNWKPDQVAEVPSDEGCSIYCTVYLWVVPARVAGTWKLPNGELRLKQVFQEITGTLTVDGKVLPISAGRVEGERIRFVAGTATYAGRVLGNRIEGNNWTAQK